MVKLNENFRFFDGQPYLFAEIAEKTAAFLKKHPEAASKLIRLGIGDTTIPINPWINMFNYECARRQQKAHGFSRKKLNVINPDLREVRKELAQAGYDRYSGYPNELGDKVLKERVNMFKYHGKFDLDEIFINSGAKDSTSAIQTIFSLDAIVALQNPAYPVYAGSNVIAGRGGQVDPVTGEFDRLLYMPCTPDNGFKPTIPDGAEIIYLCNPNNPTGTVMTHEELAEVVRYARENNAVIIHDVAYERFISDDTLPRSIYEIEGAETCAIEIGSFSKEAGMTGQRLGYIVVPKGIKTETEDMSAQQLWKKWVTTCFNGACVEARAMGLGVLSEKGQEFTQGAIDTYMANAAMEKEALESIGLEVYGAENAPYVWAKLPDGIGSWQALDHALQSWNVVLTPGLGFGSAGEGYVRLSGFGNPENVKRATERIVKRGF